MDASKRDACTMDPHEWMKLIECHPAFAAYLQAILSVLAILVAIAVPAGMAYSENKRRAKERVIHAQNIIIAAAPDVFSIWGQSGQLRKAVARLRTPSPTIGDPGSTFSTMQIPVSQVIQRLLMPTTDADPATLQPLNQLAMHVTAYNNLTGSLMGSMLSGSEQWNAALDQIDENLQVVNRVSGHIVQYYGKIAVDAPDAGGGD